MFSPAPNERLLGATRYFVTSRSSEETIAHALPRPLRCKRRMPDTADEDLDHFNLRPMDGFHLTPRGRTPRRRGYSHWSSAMVNAQHENGFHFSVRNGSVILETSSNGGIEAHFAVSSDCLHFYVVSGSYSASFAMQNVRRLWVGRNIAASDLKDQ